LISKSLTLDSDPRRVVADPESRYFGAVLEERSLVPGPGALIFPSRFEDWAAQPAT
jgi:hypothetical protein